MKMKYTFTLLVFLLAPWFLYAQEEEILPIEYPYSVVYHDLTIDLDLDQHAVTATDIITLKREIKKPPSLALLLRKGLQVTAVTYQDNPLEFDVNETVDPLFFETEIDSEDVSFYQRAEMLTIFIPEDVGKRKELELVISYSGIIQDSVKSGEFSKDYVTDQITGVISREGLYLGAGALYYPLLPEQLFTYTLRATVQKPFQIITEGMLKEVDDQELTVTETWVCEQPMESFHIIGGQYQVSSVDHKGIEVSTYFFPEQADLSGRYLEACKGYLDLYTDLIGPYPFGKFAVVDNFFASGYGMPSFTLLGSQVLRLPWIIATSLGHEICHNYWGNSVYVDYESGNWCEGLTTYNADYLYKERKSLDDAREYRIGVLRDYTAYTNAGNDFPLIEFRERHNPAQRAVGYGKSAMVYHMLRGYVGEDDFWRSLQRFFKDNIWRHASWQDVQKSFEKESALKLGWFFDQWLQRAGAPQLEITNGAKQKTEGTWQITFTLNQVQEGDIYVLDVPILVWGTSQTAHLRTGMDSRSQEITLTTIFEPVSFTVDPNFDLFRRLSLEEVAPTLADVLGKSELIIVLPSLASQDMQNAYRSLASDLMPPGQMQTRIVKDYEFNMDEIESGSVIFLGAPSENQGIDAGWLQTEHWRVQKESYWVMDQEYASPNNSLVTIERNPDQPEIPMAFISARSAEDILMIGRKLRHYGKYSYLVFERDQNVAKGNWEVGDSPLTFKF